MRVLGIGSLDSVLRKAVLVTASLLGFGYIAVNAPVIVLLGHRLSQIPITSMENINTFAGVTLFLVASVLLMMLGYLFVVGGLRHYRGRSLQRLIPLGSLLAPYYLLCLGVGSLLMAPPIDLSTTMLIVGPIVAMAAVAIYMGRLVPFKLVGSILGVVGGALLAIAIPKHLVLELVFDWGVPFPGPFMSFAIMEATVAILGPATAFVYSILENRREVAHTFLFIAALVYGVGILIGSQTLAFGLRDLDISKWIVQTVTFWSTGLVLLMLGGSALIVSAFIGFVSTTRGFAHPQKVFKRFAGRILRFNKQIFRGEKAQ